MVNTRLVAEQCPGTINNLGNYVVNFNNVLDAVSYQINISNGYDVFTIERQNK